MIYGSPFPKHNFFSIESSIRTSPTGGFVLPHDFYEIRIAGNLSSRWSNWFEGLTITQGANDETILNGELKDQADLHGVLMKIRDLHLVLISVNRTSQTPADR